MGNVPPYTAEAYGDAARVGILRHKRGKGTASDIHIHASDHNDIRADSRLHPFSSFRALPGYCDPDCCPV